MLCPLNSAMSDESGPGLGTVGCGGAAGSPPGQGGGVAAVPI